MVSDEVKGMKADDLLRLDRDVVLDLLGIQISATRMKCALLLAEGAQERRARRRRRLGAGDARGGRAGGRPPVAVGAEAADPGSRPAEATR